MPDYTTVEAFWRFALKRPRRHVFLLTHNLFPGAHFLYFWGSRGREAGQSCQGFLQNWVIFYYMATFKLRILQSWIIIYFCFNFDHTQLNTILEAMIDITLGESFANIQIFSFYTNWHEPTKVLFISEYMTDFNILQFRALVLINQRDSAEGCSKTRNTRCPVYTIAIF